mmetsp:Transcript_40265/g.59728  ORF Transcript_40265/g.59728 Transcript_40265/m.59728 type:complete len:166 (-) Transcript_40265:241-738(-)
MDAFMLVNGVKVDGMEWEEQHLAMVILTMVNIDMINVMEKENTIGMMDVFTKVAFMQTNDRVMVSIHGLMVHNTMVNSRMDNMRARARTNLPMVLSIQDIGRRDNIMDKEHAHGVMDEFIQVNGIWVRHMDVERKPIQMDRFDTMENGPMIHLLGNMEGDNTYCM